LHLITQEAIGEALRALRPEGMLVVHVSNRYYDLAPAIATAAQRLGASVLEREFEPTAAEQDAGAKLVSEIDSIDLVNLVSWRYEDPARGGWIYTDGSLAAIELCGAACGGLKAVGSAEVTVCGAP